MLWSVGKALATSAKVAAALNFIGFGVTAVTQTHLLTDITGTSAFVASAWATHLLTCTSNNLPVFSPTKSLLLTSCVTLWGVRLGSHLLQRILHSHKDPRLEPFYKAPDEPYLTGRSRYPLKLAFFWTAQAAWAWIMLLPVTVAHAAAPAAQLTLLSKLGFALFGAGWALEAIADYQKTIFKSDPKNADHWCDVGVWRYSRHPNYLGEIMAWIGLYGAAVVPAMAGRYWWTAVSPAFITLLLLYGSGVPATEAHHDKRYGDNPAYKRYKQITPVLLPWPLSRAA